MLSNFSLISFSILSIFASTLSNLVDCACIRVKQARQAGKHERDGRRPTTAAQRYEVGGVQMVLGRRGHFHAGKHSATTQGH
jgi:hypothetical protein